jgi:hypothetical protein
MTHFEEQPEPGSCKGARANGSCARETCPAAAGAWPAAKAGHASCKNRTLLQWFRLPTILPRDHWIA